jgi:hypothetical protein
VEVIFSDARLRQKVRKKRFYVFCSAAIFLCCFVVTVLKSVPEGTLTSKSKYVVLLELIFVLFLGAVKMY